MIETLRNIEDVYLQPNWVFEASENQFQRFLHLIEQLQDVLDGPRPLEPQIRVRILSAIQRMHIAANDRRQWLNDLWAAEIAAEQRRIPYEEYPKFSGGGLHVSTYTIIS